MLITAKGKHEPRPPLEAVDAVWGHPITEKQELSEQQVYRDTHCKPEVTVKSLTGRVSLRREPCSKQQRDQLLLEPLPILLDTWVSRI